MQLKDFSDNFIRYKVKDFCENNINNELANKYYIEYRARFYDINWFFSELNTYIRGIIYCQ